jgi:hypothetical protein
MDQALLFAQVATVTRALYRIRSQISGQHFEHQLRAELVLDAAGPIDQIKRSGGPLRERLTLRKTLEELTWERLDRRVDRAALVIRAAGLVI